MATAGGKGVGLSLLISRLRQAITSFSGAMRSVVRSNRYRPEKRYMRGKSSKSQLSDSSAGQLDKQIRD